MEGDSVAKQERLSAEETRAQAAILAECEKLAAAGVTFVAVHFDGWGDSGVTEDVACFDSDYYAYGEHKALEYDAARLREHFEALVPFGYENDSGFGEVVLDVAQRKITVERNDRFEDYTTTIYEV